MAVKQQELTLLDNSAGACVGRRALHVVRGGSSNTRVVILSLMTERIV